MSVHDQSTITLDTTEQVSAQQLGTGITGHAQEQPSPKQATSKNGKSRGGAAAGNSSAAKHGHRGSKMPKSKDGKRLGEEGVVEDRMSATLAAWDQKHGSDLDESGNVVRPPAVDVLLMQIRRAHERDRMAAKFLRDGQFLDGSKLTIDQQNEQREIQAAALRTVETCLQKLGLGLDTDQPTGNPASFYNRLPAFPAAQVSPQTTQGDSGDVRDSQTPPNASEKRRSEIDELEAEVCPV